MKHGSEHIGYRDRPIGILRDLPPLAAISLPLALDDICTIRTGVIFDRKAQAGVYVDQTIITSSAVYELELSGIYIRVSVQTHICAFRLGCGCDNGALTAEVSTM